MENIEQQPVKNPFARQEATKVESKKSPEISAEAKELYSTMFHEAKNALETKTGADAKAPDLTETLKNADGKTLSQVKAAVDRYRTALEDWSMKNLATATEAQKEEAIKNTSIVNALDQALAKGIQDRTQKVADTMFADKTHQDEAFPSKEEVLAKIEQAAQEFRDSEPTEESKPVATSEVFASNWPKKTEVFASNWPQEVTVKVGKPQEMPAVREMPVVKIPKMPEIMIERPLSVEDEKALDAQTLDMLAEQVRAELAPDQEAKAKDKKRVLEYFKDLPAWFKKGFSTMVERATPKTEAKEMNQEKETWDQEHIAEFSMKLEDAMEKQYPGKTREIMKAGAKNTAPELSYSQIEAQIQDAKGDYGKKLDLIKELNFRYEKNRDRGANVVSADRSRFAFVGNIAAEKAARIQKEKDMLAKSFPEKTDENQQEAA